MKILKTTMKAVIASALIRVLARTWRFSLRGDLPSSPSVVAFWHDEMLPMWAIFARKQGNTPLSALTSLSKDGDILAQLLSDWGYHVVRGSSSKGGKEALEQMITVAEHNMLLITPDGPRGPRHSMKAGAVIAAQKADVPLYLCRMAARGHRFERSWDKFLLPYPFAYVRVVITKVDISSRSEVSRAIQDCEIDLNAIGETIHPISKSM
jgi:hypothetical protein